MVKQLIAVDIYISMFFGGLFLGGIGSRQQLLILMFFFFVSAFIFYAASPESLLADDVSALCAKANHVEMHWLNLTR